jgi:hypothetical protein
VFPVLIDILESGAKSALKTVCIRQIPQHRLAGPLPGLISCFGLPTLRFMVIGSLVTLLLAAGLMNLNPIFALSVAATILFVEAAPHLHRWRSYVEWKLLGQNRRLRPGGRRLIDHADHANMTIDLDVSSAAESPLERVRLAVETSTFVDQIFDVMLSVDKTLCLIDHPNDEKPKTILADKDILALMQDLIAAQTDHDGERALVLLRQVEPMLLVHGVSVHYYTPELAGIFTLQSGPPDVPPTTLRPALVGDGRVLLPGVAETPQDAETRGVTP